MEAEIFLTLILSFGLALYGIRKIIYISHKTRLFDEPSEDRKIHRTSTPKLGGVAIFTSTMLSCFVFLSATSIPHLNFIIFSCFILFILGLTDDLVGVNPAKKILAQLLAAMAVTVLADCRFTSFHGIFGLQGMPYALSIAISTLFIIFLINAFNLIDGIDCLSGSIGSLVCLTFAALFLAMHQQGLMLTSLAICGSLAGFLLYNRTPARIFMGDTGSIFLGFIIALLSIKFIELNAATPGVRNSKIPVMDSPAGLVFALLIIPVFDTVRIFSVRIFRRKSPFMADRNHIHHRLIDLQLTHLQSTGILLLANIISLALAVILHPRTEILIFCITAYALTLNGVISVIHLKRMENEKWKIGQAAYKKPQHRVLLPDSQALELTKQA